MPKIAYQPWKFRKASLRDIDRCNKIIEEYQQQGFSLTLRQLYYQMVARGFIPNTERSYANLGNLVTMGRMTGMIDWLAIEDRTRNLRKNTHWSSPAEIIDACASSYRIDRWQNQKYRPEIWVEKEALLSVVGVVGQQWDVPYFACKGYTSVSEMWVGAQRMKNYINEGKIPIILYLGDHDPSGIDMTNDVMNRMDVFMGGIDVERVALNMDQIEELNPPPNPAKITDSRYAAYAAQYGEESWELDALSPTAIRDLIETELKRIISIPKWESSKEQEKSEKVILETLSDRFTEVEQYLTETD